MDILEKYYSLKIDKGITFGNYLENQVERIKNKIPTTQNHYGDYLALITTLIGEKIPKQISRDLIIKAGGNFEGINSAYQIINNDYNFTVINNK